MNKEEMPEVAIDTKEELPKWLTENVGKQPQWVFDLRRTLYCKAKQDPKYQFYTLYGLVCRAEVIRAGWQMVARNRGAPGMDGVSIQQIRNSAGGEKGFLEDIRKELLAKEYKPGMVRRVYIRKDNGKMRPLGIPTVKDRVVQAAVLLILEPIFEANFLDCSHGFRPGRSAHEALKEIQGNIRAGRTEAYDADLASYFDTIPHDKLIAAVQTRVTDGSIIKLIRMWLKAIVVEDSGDGKPPRRYRPKQGTPQGGVISPLLANLYLHFFDLMFHKDYGPRKWADARLVRYADDFVILAKHVGTRISDFVDEVLEKRMGLVVNREKTAIRKLKVKGNNLEFLGYVFRHERAKQWNGWYENLLPSPKSLKRMRAKVKAQTGSRHAFKPIQETIESINRMQAGWAEYFSIGFCAPAYHAIDRHTTARLIKHLKRRSQRPCRCPKGKSWPQHLKDLGYIPLSNRLRTRDSL